MKYLIFFCLIFSSVSFAQTADEVRRIMNSKNTLYEVLNVSPNATSDEIRAAYRRLMKTYHPDRFVGDPVKLKAATEIGAKLNTTRDTLMDTVARQKYDASIKIKPMATAAKTTSSAGPTKWSPEDFGKAQAEKEKTAKAAAEKAAAEKAAANKAAADKAAAAEKAKAAEQASADAKKQAQQAQQSQSTASEKPKASSASSAASSEIPMADAAAKPSTVSQDLYNSEGKLGEIKASSTTVRSEPLNAQSIGLRAKQAMKFYEDTARCGEGFFKSFIDVMQ